MTNTIVKNEGSITFAVHDVVPAAEPLHTVQAYQAINLLMESTEYEKCEPIFSCSGYNSRLVNAVVYNPLLQCVHLAFSEHRPLVLSPDMIWIAVMQGLAQHVCNNVEHLRPKLVKHAGKLELAVAGNLDAGSPESDWAGLVREFSVAIERQIGSEKHAQFMNDFSTTGELERTVSAITLMDIYQHYYEYVAYCVCGIPSVTLQGTPADWLTLRNKIEILADFEMDFWLPHLRMILDQFERASRGDIDLHHWRNIYKLTAAYGWDKINGWFGRLVPYVKNHQTGQFTIINPLFELDHFHDEPDPANDTRNPMERAMQATGITSRDVPSGISAVPFKLATETSTLNMQFLGGFLGVEQDSEMRLGPKLGWAVRKSPPSTNFLDEVATSALIKPLDTDLVEKRLFELERSVRGWGSGMPGDIAFFYKQCDGIKVNSSIGKFRSAADLEIIARPADPISFEPKSKAEQAAEDAAFLELSAKCEEETDMMVEWLRFFDFPDGTYLAISMSDITGQGRKIKQFNEPFVGITFAPDFREAILKLKFADGLAPTDNDRSTTTQI